MGIFNHINIFGNIKMILKNTYILTTKKLMKLKIN